MEIYTSLLPEEVVSVFSLGHVGPLRVGPIREDGIDWSLDWDYGVFSIEPLSRARQSDLTESFDLPSTLRTLIWGATQPYYEGQLALYSLMAHLLRVWSGDLALLNYGETVMVQRVDGVIKLRLDQMSEEILPLFKGIDYEPLLSTLDGQSS